MSDTLFDLAKLSLAFSGAACLLGLAILLFVLAVQEWRRF